MNSLNSKPLFSVFRLYNNIAMCAGKMEDWKLMTENCVKALEIDDKNLKALFRRATANEKTKKYDEVSDMCFVALALQLRLRTGWWRWPGACGP